MIEKITLELVRDTWNACYEKDRPGLLEKLFEKPLSAVDVLARQDGDWHAVPIADRFWVVLRECVLPDRILRLFAAACAEKACQDTGWNDQRSLAAIQAARDFAIGKITAEELKAARDAAWAATAAATRAAAVVQAAARAAAWDAAQAAARAAAWDAAATAATRAATTAWDAAWNAARDAWDAAWAARDTARAWQLQTLLKLIEEHPA